VQTDFFMKKIIDFVKESKTEMTEHVTWSKYDELQSNSILVLVGTLLFALLIGFMDFIFENGLTALYDSF